MVQQCSHGGPLAGLKRNKSIGDVSPCMSRGRGDTGDPHGAPSSSPYPRQYSQENKLDATRVSYNAIPVAP